MENITKEHIEHLARCKISTRHFAQTFFPQRFYRPFTNLHKKIFDVLDDDSIKRAVIVAPRGIGKTSCVQLAYAGRLVLFNHSNYIVPVSCSATQSIAQTESLKRELQSNIMIKKLFGANLQGERFSREPR